MPCSLPRCLRQVHLRLLPCPRGLPHSIDGSACLPPSIGVGFHDFTFEACSSFTRVTACQIACPPKVDFVTRLQSGRLTLPNCSSATEPCRWLLGWVLLPLVICPSGHAIELGRASCRWRVTSLALSLAKWVPSSTMATFPEAPLQSRKVGFPNSGFRLGFPREAFPR